MPVDHPKLPELSGIMTTGRRPRHIDMPKPTNEEAKAYIESKMKETQDPAQLKIYQAKIDEINEKSRK
jgi:hypothetical protein